MERIRKINIDNLSIEEVDQLSDKLGSKMRLILDEACNNINSLLASSEYYHLVSGMRYIIKEGGEVEEIIEGEDLIEDEQLKDNIKLIRDNSLQQVSNILKIYGLNLNIMFAIKRQ